MNTQKTQWRENWATLFANVPVPSDRQWAVWSLLHDPEIIRLGIGELAVKYEKLSGRMGPDHMLKFASSVMNRLTRERRSAITK